MLNDYLQRLGLSQKESRVYIALVTIGMQPASVLARKIGEDRVVTYKYLKKLSSQGLVKVFIRDGVQYFGTTGSEGIASFLNEQSASIYELSASVPDIDTELKKLGRNDGFAPVIQVFEGKAGIKSLFRDLLFEAKKEKVLRIRMLTSNTFEQQMGSVSLTKFMGEFFKDAKKAKLGIEIVEASGTLLPEYIRRIDPQHFDPDEFPAARGATNVFLAGTALYLACYGDSQVGLKIKQEQMSQIFHFFFDVIAKQAPPPDSRPPVRPAAWLKQIPASDQ